jgi:hypothetical protein
MRKKIDNIEDSEWIFRLSLQIFNLRDNVHLCPEERRAFDVAYFPLFEKMRECNDARRELDEFINRHVRDVKEGRCIGITNGQISVLEDIEPKLNRLFKEFFVTARTVLYHLFGQKDTRPQKNRPKKPLPKSVTEILLGHDLSFVQIRKDETFEEEVEAFLKKVPGEASRALIDMLRSDRKAWSTALIEIRDIIIHDVTCPRLKMNYAVIEGILTALFPTVQKTELRECVRLFWENLVGAVEETVVACLALKLPPNLMIFRLSEEARDPHLPMRWQFAPRPPHIPQGVIPGPPPKS